jgi:hypothetical protein
MWSHLVDDKGRNRGSIFYKAAFYDRAAHMNFNRRFSYGEDYEGKRPNTVVVRDGDKVIHIIGSTAEQPKKAPRELLLKIYEERDRLYAAAQVWLDSRYPAWKDVTAYWE